jgi:O-antigen ligase
LLVLERYRRHLLAESTDSMVLSVCGYLCIFSFTLALALLGSAKFSGVFYVAAIFAGIPLLSLIAWRRLRMSKATKIYVLVFVLIQALYFFHVLVMGSSPKELDNISRIGFGLMNGAFLFVLLRYRRQTLFLYLVLLALLHASVATLTVFRQALELASFNLDEWRIGGATNPIPFSEMLMASVGLVAIYLSGKLRSKRGVRDALIVALVLGVGLVAVMLTGTRGTLLALFPLALLMAANARFRHGQLYLLGGTTLVCGLALSVSDTLQDRTLLLLSDLGQLGSANVDLDALSASAGLRARMWLSALDLAADKPFLGYGLGTYPGIFHDSMLGIPSDSPLLTFNQLHNQYLDLLLETGLLGFALFCILIGTAFVAGFRLYSNLHCRDRACALMWISSCYALFGLSQSFFSHANTSLQFGVYLGILMWAIPAKTRPIEMA